MDKTHKSKIESDIKKNKRKYTFYTPAGVKSAVWKHFQLIKRGAEIVDFARCSKCEILLSYTPKGGTGSLLRHACRFMPSTSSGIQRKIDTFTCKKVPYTTKKEIVLKQLYFITKDIRPLCITEGKT